MVLLSFEEIALVQEHDHGHLGQELGVDDGPPENEGILETVDFGILDISQNRWE
jgi:hypothetical protein